MADKFSRLYAFSQQETDVYLDMDQDLRDLFSQRDSLRADLKAAQAIIVDAGQQVADLKAENERLRAIEQAALNYVKSVWYDDNEEEHKRLFNTLLDKLDQQRKTS